MTGRTGGQIVAASGPDDPRFGQIDDDFRRVLADVSIMARVSRVSKTRFFHPNATAARGELTVLDRLTFPDQEFFTPGRRFAVIARYGNATVGDDIAPDIRGVALRLFEPAAGGPGDGLLDLTLNTGECFFARTAAIFAQYAAGGAARDGVFEREPRLRDVMWDVIRGPVSYAGYDYYSQAPRCFVAEDGTMWLVRFRLRAREEHPDQGSYDPGRRRYPPDPPDLLTRDSGDPRPATFLHDELRARLAGAGLDGVLQLQLHPVTGTPADQVALDSSRAWPEHECCWHDVARLRLAGPADAALVEGLGFNVARAPESLGIALARSPHEAASLNHVRTLLYQMASLARNGRAMPPELADLARPQGEGRTTPVPRAPLAPAAASAQTSAPASPSVTPAPRAAGAERPPGPRTVCVVGAGPAGLTVACELERAGHRAIVLEERPDVGGKCESVEIEGRAFDLGGHLCTVAYDRVAALAAEFGALTEATTPSLVYDTGTRASAPQSSAFFRRDVFSSYAALRARWFPAIAEPGLAHSARALARPAGQWLAEHDLGALAESFAVGYTAAGYGFLTGDLPALYFVKYTEMTGLLSNKPSLLGHAGAFTMAGGFRSLWQRIAERLPDVRRGVRIERIDRAGGRVRVHTSAGTVDADDLVLTVPVSHLLPVLDATPAERDIAGRVRTLDYQTTICTARGLPRSAFYLVRQATEAAGRGHCVSFHHRYPDRDIYACYSYGDGSSGHGGDVEARLARDIERFGGRLGQIHSHREWAFLPHFGSDDLSDGIYDRIEDIQGQSRTYHAGSLPAFELVECVVGYAQELVRRHFPPTTGTRPAACTGRAAGTGQASAAAADTRTAEPTAVSQPLSATMAQPPGFGGLSAPIPSGVGPEEIREWLIKHIAAETRLPELEVGPNSPLDEFALDSLSIAALQGELSDWLGFRVPHATFLSVPTIDAMAQQLADASAPTSIWPAGPISHAPDRLPDGLLPLTPPRPFFCVGGAVGAASYLGALARAMGQTQAFYGVLAPGLTGDAEPPDDIGEIAERAVRLLRQVQAHGPYLVGGHSFGGLVAYEIGRALHGCGESAHVMLLDTYIPVPGQPPPPADEFACIQELLSMHRLMYGDQRAGLEIHPGQPLSQLYELLGRALGATGALPVEEYLANLIRVYQSNLIATVSYRPPPSDLPVTLFKAAEGFPPVLDGDRQIVLKLKDPANGWNSADVPGLRTVAVPGNHFSMLAVPHVDELATAVRASLGRALSAAAGDPRRLC
jgi:thioesterase domain-containing protein/acyl carrier protein